MQGYSTNIFLSLKVDQYGRFISLNTIKGKDRAVLIVARSAYTLPSPTPLVHLRDFTGYVVDVMDMMQNFQKKAIVLQENPLATIIGKKYLLTK